MAKGFKHGSGGMPLNFKVVGSTAEPTNPKENTFWLNSDHDINGWAFDLTEPITPQEGMVWIPNYIKSDAKFNALKKESIQIYPMPGKQYIGGKFVEKPSKIYQGNKWVDLTSEIYLYNKGDTCADITGGWGSNAYYRNGYIECSCNGVTDVRGACISKPIEKGNTKTLSVNLTHLTSSGGVFKLIITSSFANSGTAVIAVAADIISTGVHTLDLSNVNKPFYVYFYTYGVATAYIDKVWLR